MAKGGKSGYRKRKEMKREGSSLVLYLHKEQYEQVDGESTYFINDETRSKDVWFSCWVWDVETTSKPDSSEHFIYAIGARPVYFHYNTSFVMKSKDRM